MKKILLLGSGALKIGEAGEFDYSGSQAAKALKEEGIHTVLVNPNIATIQTSREFVQKIYFLPVTAEFVEKIIAKEKPDGVLLGFGGQTALNCGLALSKSRVFKKYGVSVLGTPISSIKKTEDRLLFRETMESLGVKVPKSITCKNVHELKKIIDALSFPVIVRAGFSLGGLGSGVARSREELLATAQKALTLSPQILIEEYLEHWKEIEYEVVRDESGNTVVVCNMENFDPMGIHTGESIVVAPSQTLTNHEYHMLRSLAVRIVNALPIIGECNVQFALHPKTGEYRVIEVNARLSRSSALASKATGYPLAYVAAKLALGYQLKDIPNQVTKATTSFFEPALDYVVVKIPRWDFMKFSRNEGRLGSEMQSVGEVMGIGRTFLEAFQKAIRSLDLEYEGIISDELTKPKETLKELHASPDRPYAIAYNMFYGQSIEVIYRQTGIDWWFLEQIKNAVSLYREMRTAAKLTITPDLLKRAKRSGFSDTQIAQIFHVSHDHIRNLRKQHRILPYVCQIDTLAGEFPAKTNYLYLSYHRQMSDLGKTKTKQVAVIGGGPYHIGSSVEFDWCAVNAIKTAKRLGYSTIMINCNPETVSTDYDISDKLYFEELTQERIRDILEIERCPVIVSVGGQIPNTLATSLFHKKNSDIRVLGTQPEEIDQAEDREKFSLLLDRLSIQQPLWARLKSKKETLEFCQKIGFPVLIRPSYVLSGSAMFVSYSPETLNWYLRESSAIVNSESAMVISKFIRGAKEVDFDAVAHKGTIIISAISEHVEHAGVHSGDATLVLPSFSLSQESIQHIKEASKKIANALSIHGPFNIQFLVNENGGSIPEVLVIEANLRASRSFPFVSKVLGVNFIDLATQAMLGRVVKVQNKSRPAYYGVKVPHFSFIRIREADPLLRVEMSSTGEVASFANDYREAYLLALLSTGVTFEKQSALVSLGGDESKQRLLHSILILSRLGYTVYATEKTHNFLLAHDIPSVFVHKVHEKGRPNVIDIIRSKKVGFVINLTERRDLGVQEGAKEFTDGYLIRRAAVEMNIPLFTKATAASLFVNALVHFDIANLKICPSDEYVKSQ